MRIIIETEATAAQPRVSYGDADPVGAVPSARDEALPEEAIDGGPPAEELLTSLGLAGAAREPLSSGESQVQRTGMDAGSAPSWLTAVIEGGEIRRPRR
jgi:hypothetical protein